MIFGLVTNDLVVKHMIKVYIHMFALLFIPTSPSAYAVIWLQPPTYTSSLRKLGKIGFEPTILIVCCMYTFLCTVPPYQVADNLPHIFCYLEIYLQGVWIPQHGFVILHTKCQRYTDGCMKLAQYKRFSYNFSVQGCLCSWALRIFFTFDHKRP